MALLRNLVDGCIKSIEFVFDEDGLILDTVGRQLRKSPQAQMAIQVRKMIFFLPYQWIKEFADTNVSSLAGNVCAHECSEWYRVT